MSRVARSRIWPHSKSNAAIRQKHWLPVAWLVGLALLTTGFGPPVITDGGYPAVRLYPDQIDAMRRSEQPPHISAVGAVVYDVDAKQQLYALNASEPLPPASTAKIMTALVVLQHARLDDPVTVSATAASTEGSTMGLAAGETLSVQQLLYGLLLPSGNDAAIALAEHVSGSEAAFVDQMNQTAAGMGLTGSHFANPHGLDAPGQVISAGDLVTVTVAALRAPVFAEIVATPSATIAGHALVNTNELLTTYHGADGIKTGTTDNAGQCLVASVTRGGHRLLVALLGSMDRYADARALLDYAAAGWSWQNLILPDDALAWAAGPDGHAYRLAPAGSTSLLLPAWQWPLIRPVRAITATLPFNGTLPVGTLRYLYGGQVLASVPLTLLPGP